MREDLGHFSGRFCQSVNEHQDFIRCLKCDGRLSPSGVEVHRYICESCGQHYHAVLQFVPVDAPCRGLVDVERSPTSNGRKNLPKEIR